MMKGFIAGLMVGVLGVAGHTLYRQYTEPRGPCLGRCGDGTTCVHGRCEVAVAAPKLRKKKSARRRKRSRRRPTAGSSLAKPTAAQLRQTRGGQALGKVDVVDLAGELGGGATRELSAVQVTAKVRRLDPEIIACIQGAGRGYDLGTRAIKVEVGFRIERSGRVSKVQVKAPRLLHQQGLLGCVRPLLRALVFPESARALIMKYPYALD